MPQDLVIGKTTVLARAIGGEGSEYALASTWKRENVADMMDSSGLLQAVFGIWLGGANYFI